MPSSRGRGLLPLAACTALLLPRPARAQVWSDDSLYSQFSWGGVFVVVHADMHQGVRLSAAAFINGFSGDRHSYNGHFKPDSVLDWLNSAHAVASYAGHSLNSDDSTSPMQTRPLYAEDSSAVVVSRERAGPGWSDRISLIFVSGDSARPWSIEARPEEADSLFRTLFTQASRSALSPPDTAPPVEPLDASTPSSEPVLLATPVRPKMPIEVRGQDGVVLMQFVVGTDGRAEPSSLEPIVYSDPRLVQPAFDVILAARFRPGTVNEEPVRVQVRQGVRFGRR